jgi:hypothetical protein
MNASAVMLRCAQHLATHLDRPFAALRVTVEVPMYRPSLVDPKIRIILLHAIIAPTADVSALILINLSYLPMSSCSRNSAYRLPTSNNCPSRVLDSMSTSFGFLWSSANLSITEVGHFFHPYPATLSKP